MAQTTTLIVKLHLGSEIRRFTHDPSAALTWGDLKKRIKHSFDLSEARKLRVTYVDDDKDVITISTNDELQEAMAIALSAHPQPATLRLTVVPSPVDDSDKGAPDKQDQSTQNTTNTANGSTNTNNTTNAGPTLPPGLPVELAPFINTMVQQLPGLMGQLPDELKRFLPHAELDLAATIAANAAANNVNPASERTGGDSFCPANPHGPNAKTGIHEGVTCDKSGVCPIVGNRYHLVGHNYDLCEEEWMKLSDKEKANFRKVPPPGAAPPATPTATPGSGNNNTPNTTTSENKIHPGVECDKSGMFPISGTRYHMRGHNYDLCQAEWDKLSAADKLLYDAIPPPPQNANAPGLYTGRWGPGGGWGGPGGGWGWRQGMGGGCRGMGGGHGGMGRGADHPKLAARFVRDVTIFDGTQMAPGTVFTKIWRLKNVGEVPWPPGSRMLFVGGDQMTNEMSVPLSRVSAVMPGEEVDVAVEMTAPMELGRYIGHWRLTGPMMRRKFGQRFCCHVQVVDPSAEPSTTFDDLPQVLAEIEQKKAHKYAEDDEAAEEEAEETKTDSDVAMTDEAKAAAAKAAAARAAAAKAAAEAEKAEAEAAAALTSSMNNTHIDVTDKDLTSLDEAAAPKEEEDKAAAVAAAVAAAKAAAEEEDDLYGSDDGVLVTDGFALVNDSDLETSSSSDKTKVEGKAVEASGKDKAAVTAAAGTSKAGVYEALAAMGFHDASLVALVVSKHGDDVEACARDLAAITSEWAPLLDDLEEMGFNDKELNKQLMLKNNGNMKRTVRDLVEA